RGSTESAKSPHPKGNCRIEGDVEVGEAKRLALGTVVTEGLQEENRAVTLLATSPVLEVHVLARVQDLHEFALADRGLISRALSKTRSGTLQRSRARQLDLARELVTLETGESFVEA